MGEKMTKQAAAILHERKKRSVWIVLFLCLATAVTIGTAGVFRLRGIAKTYQERVLTCTATPKEGEGYAEFFVHTHNDDCYDRYGNLVCELPEIEAHEHDGSCYTTYRKLVCDIPESEGHHHSEECYTRTRGELICDIPESEGHHHSAECYTRVRGELICGQEACEQLRDESGRVIQEGHQHTDDCYEWHDELICGKEEGEGAHLHTDDCYEWKNELTCGKTEGEGAHHHTDACYRTSRKLTCDKPEIRLHTHTEECFETDKDGNVYLICDELEVREHVHGEECFTIREMDDGIQEEALEEPAGKTEIKVKDEGEDDGGTESAGSQETSQDELGSDENKSESVNSAGNPNSEPDTEGKPVDTGNDDSEEVSNDASLPDQENTETESEKKSESADSDENANPEYETGEKSVITGNDDSEEFSNDASVSDQENTETESEKKESKEKQETTQESDLENSTGSTDNQVNPRPESDMSADVETADDWAESVAGVTLTGNWGLDIAHVAESQLGYTESSRNYIAAEDGSLHGYTRYGAYYNMPYSVWDAAFASFCIEYAKVAEWAFPLNTNTGLWIDSLSGIGKFTFPQNYMPKSGDLIFFDKDGDGKAEHCGIVTGCDENQVNTVEGGGDAVIQCIYSLNDETVFGYGIMPENPDVSAGDGTDEVSMPAQNFTGTTDYVTVSVDAPEGAFPEGTVMKVTAVTDDETLNAVAGAVEGTVTDVLAVDIVFLNTDGDQIEPQKAIKVSMKAAIINESENISVVHLPDTEEVTDDNPPEIREDIARLKPEIIEAELVSQTENTETSQDAIVFEANTFSVYALVGTTIEKHVLASDGHNYRITLTCSETSGIPEGAELQVEEILSTSELYGSYMEKTLETIGLKSNSLSYARFFDISIIAEGETVQPAEGATVTVDIRLDDMEKSTEPQVIHFGQQTEVIDTVTDGQVIRFEANAFSIYAVVEVPEPEEPEYTTAKSISDLTSGNDNLGFYLSVTGNSGSYYFTDKIGNNLILKTGANTIGSAAIWYFEKEEETENQFRLYTSDESGTVSTYMCMNSFGHMSLAGERSSATIFTVELYSNNQEGKFYIYQPDPTNNTKYGLNMFGGENGKGFGGWTGKDGGSAIVLTYPVAEENDPAELDGKTFGLVNYYTGTYGAAMMSEQQNGGKLVAAKIPLRTDPLSHGDLYVAKDSSITEWKFHNISGAQYYITTEVDGQEKYLCVAQNAISIVDEPNDNCILNVTQGTGSYKGRIRISNGSNYSPNLYSGNVANGFGSYNDSGKNEWFRLAKRSDLTEEDFVSYSAYKVSISDVESVPDGAQVVIYTREWNDSEKKYEFYAIDHEGNLVQAYENGDMIEWIGLKVNNLLWDLTEYHNAGTTTPNYYYDLKNVYSEKYLSPKRESDSLLSDSAVGINLNGRRYGYYYSTILAWDDPYYDYAGYKVENGRLISCALSEAEDFYFAIMEEPTPDQLTKVDTVDNSEYGITMKMRDYNGTKIDNGSHDQTQLDVIGSKGDEAGLVTSYLSSDGYPIAKKTDRSLSELFGDEATEVNHLFLDSIYQQSGYFEFNSTKNFAHLEESGDFTVYNQIGTIESGNQSLDHGQFMPYNDLNPGVYSNMHTNLTDELDQELSDNDPRKGEKLYAIPYDKTKAEREDNNADFHFGMEMEASFTQTADGLDAWGHDIIFEFAGDDDMWLYVDGVQILDLGGVHAARVGKVNFRTGAVVTSRRTTTLRVLFEESYRAQYPDATDDEVNAWLNGIFKDGGTVFKDYTSHTMKMLYMERGAGASNLHMRFNLAAVKPGTVVLSKKLSGAESSANSLIEFPYQIKYRMESDGGRGHILGDMTGDENRVTYKDTANTVKYQDSFEPAGGGDTYDHVFLLKPGETAVIDLPDDTISYEIVECAVNRAVYDPVMANGVVLQGTTGNQGNRSDYTTGNARMEDRPEVDFDNHVKEGAMRTLSISKALYDSDPTTRLHYDVRAGEKQDQTTFSFRVYLGNENEKPEDLPLANMYSYHVKNRAGQYCVWDSDNQKFQALNISDYAVLAASEALDKATFRTSIYGTVSNIPADYTVEFRDLIVGTQWKVEERESEIPKGYTLRLSDGYQRIDTGHESNTTVTPISGIMELNQNPKVLVSNQKGWGLTVEKNWTDKDFMQNHDTVYFAVYVEDGAEERLLDDSVMAMETTESSLYYFFGNLQSGIPFNQYVVYEVKLTGESIAVDENGKVTGYATIQPIENNAALEIGGTPVGSERQESYSYTVTYTQGEQTTQNENVRTDTVTNARPGIELYKTDWEGAGLADAVFTLKDKNGKDVGQESYTSRSTDGLITVAYLNEGEYTLTETVSPKGYVGLTSPLIITVDGEMNVTVDDDSLCKVETPADSSSVARITIRNRTAAFQIIKEDGSTYQPISGTHFALYRQVKNNAGELVKDYNPMEGYTDLVTGENGVLDKVNLENLNPGTYYLSETDAAEGYDRFEDDLVFTIKNDGTVEVISADHTGWITVSDDEQGKITYTIRIPNNKMQRVSFKKADIVNLQGSSLGGAVFDLYRVTNGSQENTPLLEKLTSRETDGFLEYNSSIVFELENGTYHLVETVAPAGYNILPEPVVITVNGSSTQQKDGSNPLYVTYKQTDNSASQDNSGIIIEKTNDKYTYTLLIANSAGYELPATGGMGTAVFYVVGGALTLIALVILLTRKRMDK